MKKLMIAATAALTTFAATAASAVTIEVDGISAYFQNTTGATPTGEGTASIRWGDPASNAGQSGYDFVAEATPFTPVSSPFDIGTFTHINQPIFAPSITGTELVVGVSGTADGVAFTMGGTYLLTHTETPNNANPCAEGGINPCPDLVTLSGAVGFFGDDIFNADGDQIFLDIAGFENGTLSFLTLEGQSNSALLQAAFTVDPFIAPVPLPAGMVLLLSGLGLLAVKRRKS